MSNIPLTFLDTQIISYAFKKHTDLSISGKIISSITANEFLLIQGNNPAQANYYVPLLSRNHFPEVTDGVSPFSQRLSMDHPFHKNITDQVIIDFGNEYPTIVEYGNLAISMLINKQITGLFYEAIKFLDKVQRKILRKRYDFLLENEITCIPLNRSVVEVSMDLLQEFRKQYNFKANFRNSLNDILILSSVIDSSAILITEDNLLNKFAAEQYSGNYNKSTDVVTINFDKASSPSPRKNSESKGYINRGWQVRFRNYGNRGVA